jgi:hypothetical protein
MGRMGRMTLTSTLMIPNPEVTRLHYSAVLLLGTYRNLKLHTSPI